MKVIANNHEPKNIIKFIRQATNLTQKDFGEKIGKCRNTVQSYELGRIKMSFNDFIDICNQFNFKITIEEKTNITVKQ